MGALSCGMCVCVAEGAEGGDEGVAIGGVEFEFGIGEGVWTTYAA